MAPCGSSAKYVVATHQEHTMRMPLVPHALGTGRSLAMGVAACQDALELQLPDSSPGTPIHCAAIIYIYIYTYIYIGEAT